MLIIFTFFAFLVTGISASSLKFLSSNGVRRSYWAHTPSNYDDSKSYPIVLAFHGSSKLGHDIDGFSMEADTRLTLPIISTKYSESKIFVYPNGVGGTWAGPSYANSSIPQDLQFISDLLSNVKENFNIDDSRVYATGLSNGGGFIGILACAPIGNKFSAFAAVAGAFYEKAGGIDVGNCAVGRGVVPMLEIHGGSDKTVKYAGGVGEGDHYWPSKTENVGMLVAKAGPQPIEANDIVIGFFDKFRLEN
ncbi:hypothetical protein BLS_003474 [Venturia inaequalis]|uniref:feruloyl esterase n=1 Tax=Venturia inaequalis TaxID=5025 RepID=A0A8H3UQW1_VENIN|nr:hypothetical protein BLS_003474 [Venturia inaequalis]KAE9975645.1 hypothetical protein EG328_003096 [Venturia inaequalis]